MSLIHCKYPTCTKQALAQPPTSHSSSQAVIRKSPAFSVLHCTVYVLHHSLKLSAQHLPHATVQCAS